MPINAIGIISLIVVVLNIGLGAIVFFKNPKNANNIVYAISVFSIAAWALSIFIYNNPLYLEPALWLKIVYVASYGMLLAQMMFAYIFPRRVPSRFWLYMLPIVITLIPSAYVLLVEDTVVLSATHYGNLYLSIAEMGSGYFIYTLPNILGICLIAWYFLNKSKKFIGYEKAQIHFYMLGTLLMMIPLVIVDYGIPLSTGDTSLFVYSPLFAIPFSVAVAYSILQNRFLTIKVILKRSFAFLLSLGFSILAIAVFLSSYDYMFKGNDLNVVLYCAICIAVYILLYRPLVSLLLNALYKDERSREVILNNFFQVSNIELTVDRIVINVKRTIKHIFRIEKTGIILFDKRNFSVRYKSLEDFENISSDYLVQIVKNWGDISLDQIIVADEIKRKILLNKDNLDQRVVAVVNAFSKSEVSVAIPFNSRTQLNGVLLLGYRNDKYPLSIEDIGLLEKIISNISVSIGRAVLYKEFEDLNKTLQDKVNEQTKELKVKVEELEEARRKETDMIDIMGHELRTPATVVKLNAQLLEKYINSNPVDFKKYIERIKRAVNTEIGLINTLLTSAKLEGSQVDISCEKVDIKNEIEMAIHGHESEINEKGLEYIDRTETYTPEVYGDRVRVAEVLNNLVSNAIKYTVSGHISVYTKHDDNFVTVVVEDTGKGIPDEKISILGRKFGRIDNYLGSEIVRPGGTGLGLYVTFGLVRLMGGDIWVESEVGKGSKFSFTLPVYNGQKIENNHTNDMFEKMGLRK